MNLKSKIKNMGKTAGAGLATLLLSTPSSAIHSHENDVLLVALKGKERQYVAAGKTPYLMQEVERAAKHINQNGGNITPNDLLDGDNSNYEFRAVRIDESDPFNDKVGVIYFTPAGETDGLSYSGFGAGNGLFIEGEAENMAETVPEGEKLEGIYRSNENPAGRLQHELDAQNGIRENGRTEKSTWTPRYEHQMGFETEGEFRDVLDKTQSIDISYEPHSSFPMGFKSDFHVVYNLDDGTKVERRVSDMPLSVLDSRDRLEVMQERSKSRLDAMRSRSDASMERMRGRNSSIRSRMLNK